MLINELDPLQKQTLKCIKFFKSFYTEQSETIYKVKRTYEVYFSPKTCCFICTFIYGIYNAPGILRSLFCLSLSTPNDW